MRYLIEGHWEEINDLYDVSRVIYEYYNRELSSVLDDLIELKNDEIKCLENEIDALEFELESQ